MEILKEAGSPCLDIGERLTGRDKGGLGGRAMHKWRLRFLELCSACKVLRTSVLSLMGHFSQGSLPSQSHRRSTDSFKLVLET